MDTILPVISNGNGQKVRRQIPDEKDRLKKSKLIAMIKTILLISLLLLFIFLFISSIDFLTDSFRLLGGKEIAHLFKSNVILNSPVADIMIGLLFTTVLQSSTVTTISVAMVNAEALTVQQGIYIIMGANVGTAITTMIVALFESSHKEQFRRAFAAATIHSVYNWMGLLFFFPVEWIVELTTGKGLLNWTSGKLVDFMGLPNDTATVIGPSFIERLVDPFTERIVQVDDHVISLMIQGVDVNQTITKHLCYDSMNNTAYKCAFLLNVDLSDRAIGAILVTIALTMLFMCIVGTIKVLNALLGGHVQQAVKHVLNFQVGGRCQWLSGYLCIFLGAAAAFVVQSSSIFIATLVPLVAMDVLSLERFWVFEVGADVGTSGVSLLAAFSTDTLVAPLQLATSHFLFNTLSIPLFYSIPAIRRIPLLISTYVGDTTAEYKWFAVVYMLFVFLLAPLLLLGLSVAGVRYLAAFGGLASSAALFALVVHVLQTNRPGCLPPAMRDWTFLPRCLRSWSYWDRVVRKSVCYVQLKKLRSARRRRRATDTRLPPDGQTSEINL